MIQTVTGKFTCDNAYAIYVGDKDGVRRRILPKPNLSQLGVVNTTAKQIFDGESVTFDVGSGDYFYIIAWSDDRSLQGLLGSFEGFQLVKTGDPGWEVLPTARDVDNTVNNPDMGEINTFIANAKPGDWKTPTSKYKNSETFKLFGGTRSIPGIDLEAQWTWYDSGKDKQKKAPFAGFNHDEFLIFRIEGKEFGIVEPEPDCAIVRKEISEAQKKLVLEFLNGVKNPTDISDFVKDDPNTGSGNSKDDYGIGKVVAKRIIEKRDSIGGFTSISQLCGIPGFGFDKYCDLLYSIELSNPILCTQKIRVFLRTKEDHKAIKGKTLGVELTEKSRPGKMSAKKLHLGYLNTDTNGYVSFHIDCRYRKKIWGKIWLYPAGMKDKGIDLLNVLTGEEAGTPYDWVVPQTLAEKFSTIRNLPSVQNVDLMDFKLSPLALSGTSLLFGEFDCEKLVPQQVQTQCFYLHQVSRLADNENEIATSNSGGPQLEVHAGRILRLEVCYDWLGYSLGKLIESMTLAPCETVNVGMKEWRLSLDSFASQSEDLREQLDSRITSERMIQETVKGSVREFGIGFGMASGIQASTSAGASGGASGSLGQIAGNLSAQVASGLKAFLGSSISASFNSRKFAAETVQKFNEQVQHQASRIMSSSTVAVQKVTQDGSEKLVTRRIHNPNHCHTETINYYEVLDNFGVSTSCVHQREALLVKYPLLEFTAQNIACKRHIFAGRLLDPLLESCLETIGKAAWCCAQQDNGQNGEADCIGVSSITANITIGDNGTGSMIRLVYVVNGNLYKSNMFPRKDARYKRGDSYKIEDIAMPKGTCIGDITEIGLQNHPDNFTDGAFELASLYVSYKSPDFNGSKALLQHGPTGKISRDETKMLGKVQPALPEPQVEPQPPCSEEEECCAKQLVAHFNCNQLFYNKLLWLSEDPDEIAIRFEDYTYNNQLLIDYLNPHPYAIMGQWVAFDLANPQEHPFEDCPYDDRVISLPTGGIFSEALKGRCNTCEEVDAQILQNHTDHPCNCGCDGPQIELASGGSTLDPLNPNPQLPGGNVISIQNPPGSPESGFLSGLLGVLANPNFNDPDSLGKLAEIFKTLAGKEEGDKKEGDKKKEGN